MLRSRRSRRLSYGGACSAGMRVRAVPGCLRWAGAVSARSPAWRRVAVRGTWGSADAKLPSGACGARQVSGSWMGCPRDGVPWGRAAGVYGSVRSFAANPTRVCKCWQQPGLASGDNESLVWLREGSGKAAFCGGRGAFLHYLQWFSTPKREFPCPPWAGRSCPTGCPGQGWWGPLGDTGRWQ